MVDLAASEPRPPRSGANPDAFEVGPVDFSLAAEGALLMVADGMGGRAGGERASQAAVDAVRAAMSVGPRSWRGEADFVRSLGRALTDANRRIHEQGANDEQLRGMGTTATLAGLLGRVVYLAQVGDSRAYLARNGTIGRLTRDQSLVQDLIDMGVLAEDDEYTAENNQILQALGSAASVQPVFTHHELRRGDVLLLCSDGLSGVVRDGEVLQAVEAASDCVALCDDLVALANARGGPDNITVVAARIDGDGLDEPRHGERVKPLRYETTGG